MIVEESLANLAIPSKHVSDLIQTLTCRSRHQVLLKKKTRLPTRLCRLLNVQRRRQREEPSNSIRVLIQSTIDCCVGSDVFSLIVALLHLLALGSSVALLSLPPQVVLNVFCVIALRGTIYECVRPSLVTVASIFFERFCMLQTHFEPRWSRYEHLLFCYLELSTCLWNVVVAFSFVYWTSFWKKPSSSLTTFSNSVFFFSPSRVQSGVSFHWTVFRHFSHPNNLRLRKRKITAEIKIHRLGNQHPPARSPLLVMRVCVVAIVCNQECNILLVSYTAQCLVEWPTVTLQSFHLEDSISRDEMVWLIARQ